MAYGHLSCSLEQLAVTPVPLLPIAQHLPVHPRVPSGMEPGSQGSSLPLEFLRAYLLHYPSHHCLDSLIRNILSIQPTCNEQGHLQLDQVAQSPVQLDLECFQGWGIYHPSGQPVPVFHHPHILKGCNKVSPEPSLLQAEQPQLSQPFLIGDVFHPSDHFCGPPLDPLQQVHVFPVLRAPELDAVLQVGSHQSRVEGQNHLPRPAGHASFDAAWDTVGLLGCECTLLARVQLFIHQYPYVLLPRAALNPFNPQPVLISGVALTQVQDPALGLVEPHEVHISPLLELVQVPLDGILSLRCVNCTTQLGVICKLAEGALKPTVYVTDEDIKHMDAEGRHLSPISINIELLTTTLWMRPSHQFLIHRTVHPSNPYLSNSERRTLWRTMSKALQKSR
ncbi:hypothetical protein QYF61_015281 [Mycteria americana]|uniref:Uncharacterized protein n=1 Tax=Mycteria americana TaxID=33587 RepID=A0AAN7PTJ4_MYCAM|nr:hypothetical protein QYF61_015281 [Mycteria americana]